MSFVLPAVTMEFPSGALALGSPFYIDRPPLETRCYQNLQVPGSLTRIKGPRHTGKSSLLVKLLAQAETLTYRTALIDFQAAEAEVYTNLSRFLRWFCMAIARQLQLPPKLDEYWDDEAGAKMSTTIYFEDYLLEAIEAPIVLAFNEVNKVFEHPDIAQDFLPLLRFWYEQAKHNSSFQQLRTIVVHSTDICISLNVHQSPFNVGLPVQLVHFNLSQIQQLEKRYNLSLNAAERDALVQLVGGHPYLISIAFYHLAQGQHTLSQLISEAPTTAGIYTHHLQSYLQRLQQQPLLLDAVLQVFKSDCPVTLPAVYAHQLTSLGLVSFENSTCTSSCELYKRYFSQLSFFSDSKETRFQALEAENQHLKALANLDGLTQIYNRRFFDSQLQLLWQQATVKQTEMALLMIDIDCFKPYNDTYGHIAGDLCLQKIAQTMRQQVQRRSDVVARYGGEEFSVILPETALNQALRIAHKIRESVCQLQIAHTETEVQDKIVTLSIGVACTIPNPQQACSTLISEADAALYIAKQKGRNQVIVSASSS